MPPGVLPAATTRCGSIRTWARNAPYPTNGAWPNSSRSCGQISRIYERGRFDRRLNVDPAATIPVAWRWLAAKDTAGSRRRSSRRNRGWTTDYVAAMGPLGHSIRLAMTSDERDQLARRLVEEAKSRWSCRRRPRRSRGLAAMRFACRRMHGRAGADHELEDAGDLWPSVIIPMRSVGDRRLDAKS